MAKFKVEWCENKNEDWKVASLSQEGQGVLENVSINRINKKNEIFPNFEHITSGATIEGELWKSPAGKLYLFGPKEVKSRVGNYSAKPNISKMMEKKEESIKHSQDRREIGIEISSTFRDATLIMNALYGGKSISEAEFRVNWTAWRKWLIERYNDTDLNADVPFN